jgi:hypothetical protein
VVRRRSYWQVDFAPLRPGYFPAVAVLERMQARHRPDLVHGVGERLDALEYRRWPGDDVIGSLGPAVDLRTLDVFADPDADSPTHMVIFAVEHAAGLIRVIGIHAAQRPGQRLRCRRAGLARARRLYGLS